MAKEIWKDIVGYEGFYQVSDLGRVKSFYGKKEKIMKLSSDGKGYLHVNLSVNLKKKTFKVHKLVSINFLNHVPCGYNLVVNHINFIKTDNRVKNLEIITQRENASKKKLKSKSKYTGVTLNKSNNKWTSSIRVEGRLIHLGVFKEEIEASDCYKEALTSLNNKKAITIKKHNYSSKYKGVSFNKETKKWICYVKLDKKHKVIGYFKNEEEAFRNLIQYKINTIKTD